MRGRSRWSVLMLLLASSLAVPVPGVVAQDQASQDDAAEELAAIESMLAEIAPARTSVNEDIERVEGWADAVARPGSDVVVVRPGGVARLMSRADLTRYVAIATMLDRGRSGSGLDAEGVVTRVERLGLALDDAVLESLMAMATFSDRSIAADIVREAVEASESIVEGTLDSLRREAADIDELERLLIERRAELLGRREASVDPEASVEPAPVAPGSSAGPEASFDPVARVVPETAPEELAAAVGGPFGSCVWRTGYHIRLDEIPDMRIYAWTTGEPEAGATARFEYSTAWPEEETDDPDRLFRKQDEALAAVLAESGARQVFGGSASGFCRFVDATCPSYRPAPCDTILGE